MGTEGDREKRASEGEDGEEVRKGEERRGGRLKPGRHVIDCLYSPDRHEGVIPPNL
jgi:hypothetical protein